MGSKNVRVEDPNLRDGCALQETHQEMR